VQGAQTAVVVGPAGEETFTDKYGRVKVQFHWDPEGKNNADSSCWVRVATHWAGKQWGIVHIPRVGQKVLVAFLEGDPDQPIIVGAVKENDDDSQTTIVGKHIGITSGTDVAVEAKDKILLKVGESRITITPDKIEIQSKQVHIEGSDLAQLQSATKAEVVSSTEAAMVVGGQAVHCGRSFA
jgi:uncharacterized protein involved in type VI secretion and phage assembly